MNKHRFIKTNVNKTIEIKEFGTEIVLKVKTKEDLNRTVVRSEYGVFEIPEIELTIPPKTTSGGMLHKKNLKNKPISDLTTIEGVLQSVKTDLQALQPQRRVVDPETAEKLDRFIAKIDNLLSLEVPWTLVKFIIYKKKCILIHSEIARPNRQLLYTKSKSIPC